jgi:hypothetical protein
MKYKSITVDLDVNNYIWLTSLFPAIWANHAASARLPDQDSRNSRAAGSFENAVGQIAASLHASEGKKGRLQILMLDWYLKLPMASAVLTVLYKDDLTVHDVRVCKQLVFE